MPIGGTAGGGGRGSRPTPWHPPLCFVRRRLIALPTAGGLKHAIKAQVAGQVAAIIVGARPGYATAPGRGVTQGGTRFCGWGGPRILTPVWEAQTLGLLQGLHVRKERAHRGPAVCQEGEKEKQHHGGSKKNIGRLNKRKQVKNHWAAK